MTNTSRPVLWQERGEHRAEGAAAGAGGSAPAGGAGARRGRAQPQYEFSRWEERIMEVVMEAMRMAGLALGLQAFSSVAVGAPGWARVSMV